MKFEDMKYERPNMDVALSSIDRIVEGIKMAGSADEVLHHMHQFDDVAKDFETAANLVSVRYSIDTTDEFYEAEDAFFNENSPKFEAKSIEFAKAILATPFRLELEERVGKHYFDMFECSLVLNDKAIPFMVKENELVTKYNKLKANGKIEFEGKSYTLTQMSPLLQDSDRDRRRRAYEAQNAWYEQHEDEFDSIYDELVKTRTEMAQALGCSSYVELQYKLLQRTDYDHKDVAAYREKLLKNITPIAVELRRQQAERVGISDFKFYDRPVDFTDGNPDPKGGEEFIVKNAQKMYSELSEETGRFFNFMVENNLMDLVAKPGKQAGGYCTSFDKYKSPFIFSNFNGTRGDVEVITHEAGHAFQNFMSQGMEFINLIWPTYEACEIHSMSMEFLTWPWMDLFFEEDTNKFKYAHLKSSIVFLPYGATIDEFQHFVYENPTATPAERKAKYHEIELKYQPDLNYDNECLNRGSWWHRQGHVFSTPFYYIDYTLAQVCAFQYLLKSLDDKDKAVHEYITLCKEGGQRSFFNLLPVGKIENPMTTDVLEKVAPRLLEILNSIEI